MQLTKESKKNLISDINLLFIKDKYGNSLYSMRNIKTINFIKKSKKQYALLKVLLSIPIDLINIINDYTLNEISTKYWINFTAGNSINNVKNISMSIELEYFKCHMNIYTDDFLSFNVTISGVQTNAIDELIYKHQKNIYHYVYDYLLFFNYYMKEQYNVKEYFKSYIVECNFNNQIIYTKESQNCYTCDSIRNENGVTIKRIILNHKRLYNIILIIRVMLDTMINIIKMRKN